MKTRIPWCKSCCYQMFLLFTVLPGSPAAWAAEYWAPTVLPSYSIRTLPAIEPIDLQPGPHLFIDDYLIAESDHLTTTTHSPTRFLEEPILGYQQQTTQPYLTVIRDPQTQTFRMWYNYGMHDDAHIAYAESDDGIHWQTPQLGIVGPDNRLFQIHGFDVNVIDEGPNFAQPQERYKMAWHGGSTHRREGDVGLRVATSPDGLHWTEYEHNPVLISYADNDPRKHIRISDIVDVYYDPIRKHYAGFFKSWALASDGYIPGPRASTEFRRLVAMSTSDDFFHWRRPWRVMTPEPRDEGLLEFYGCSAPLVRGNLMIGFVRMLHDDYPVEPGGEADGIGYSALATSRDGVTWQRHDDIFFDRNPKPDTWDRAMTWIGCVVPVGDENYIYYGGYKLGHKKEKRRWRQLGLAKMPRDRFVSRGATGDRPGRFLTVAFNRTPNEPIQITLNADAVNGTIRIRLCDEFGNCIEGHDFEDCVPIQGDGLSLPVCWKQNQKTTDAVLLNTPIIRMDFEITNAQLFGFDFPGR